MDIIRESTKFGRIKNYVFGEVNNIIAYQKLSQKSLNISYNKINKIYIK